MFKDTQFYGKRLQPLTNSVFFFHNTVSERRMTCNKFLCCCHADKPRPDDNDVIVWHCAIPKQTVDKIQCQSITIDLVQRVTIRCAYDSNFCFDIWRVTNADYLLTYLLVIRADFKTPLLSGLGILKTFLSVTAGTAVTRLSHRNSVRPSICPSHGWIRQKQCKLESPNLHCQWPERLKFQNL